MQQKDGLMRCVCSHPDGPPGAALPLDEARLRADLIAGRDA
ncbi:hypothetical protein SAMN05660710_02421 [Paracoccus tibetensis]|uniref:Uncharacterized protein n=1 Tax=Paracoccus tibetensis TaxID=336292 RepID=A0A1G5I5K8_9RHOB|nr:hypothetical protein SAMN05660710_02421 [Paracoccus tibetensis]